MRFEIEVNKHTTALLYLANVYSIDVNILFLLWERYGEDVLLFFYMFEKEKITIPSENKLNRVITFSKELCNHFKGSPIPDTISKQEETQIEFLSSLRSKNGKSYVIEVADGFKSIKGKI